MLDTTRLETLVLARLLVRPKSGFGPSELRRQLFPFVSHTLSDADWRDRLSGVLQRLETAKWVEAAHLRLTPDGQAEALRRLSLSSPPTQVQWTQFVADVLVPAAIGLPPENARTKGADDLVAVLLAREFDLAVGSSPTLAQVLNAMVWQALGIDSSERLTQAALQRAILKRHLEGTRVQEPDRMARILAAKLSGARSAGSVPTRQAILREWVAGGPASKDARRPKTMSTSPVGVRIESFAKAALRAARAPDTVRFGEHKAFIDSVFEQYASAEKDPLTELGMFKQQLVAAHRKGLLTLARADLVEAMDPKRVAASETRYLNSTFHFVEAY